MSSTPPSSSSRSSTPGCDGEAHHERTLTILYATETGTAQDVADRLARVCRCLHIHARVHSMDAYSPAELINEHLVIFVVATTGTGREPRAMTPLWQTLLRADLPEDLFEDLHFAVFGLGDTAYEKFCWPAKLLSRRLEALGGTELCARGEGDEQHHLGIEGALAPWIEQLSAVLLEAYPLPDGLERELFDSLPSPRVAITEADTDAQITRKDPLVADREYHTATLVVNSRLTAEDWYQDVRHFEFELAEDVEYDPGDVAIIHPEAMPQDVEAFLSCIGYANTADDPIEIRQTLLDQHLPDHIPTITTLREVFTRYVDINAIPRRSFFALLKHFAQDDMEREKLEEFLSEEGADDLYEYCQKPHRRIHEVLDEFRSIKIPREYIFDLFPPLRPRQFSIASSIRAHQRRIHLCIAIVQYRTMLKIPRRGVCTTWLANLKPGDKLQIGLQKGFITLPNDPAIPVICVGPGTGVAPMRAVIQERLHAGLNTGDDILYFGCRSEAKDHYYGAEWRALAAEGKLTYRVAFSRDGPEGKPRTYVQDLIREDAKRIWVLVGERGAWVYISGSSNKMPAAVRAAIAHTVQSEGGRTEEEAKEYVARMEREGRLIEECWS
ncbi:riboflavin synthase domain-like protein [Dichomitus squalens]|uniref:NADPH-dependent diflavin oxidoreductase 1 n=1 Tax=Dichomitus squalens TaxID=114155 RepID=A0A4Q9NIM8_9APHY|nr:riboflavin synthase domain-like protein [Dichomitus squalens]TBU55699.1 riboflavin synthase domain-like protein [Dichomitus squalens]